jgi:hypothetical protein
MALSSSADRVNLYQVMQQHPGWSAAELAHVLKRSRSPGEPSGVSAFMMRPLTWWRSRRSARGKRMRPNIPQYELIPSSRSRFSPFVTSLLRDCGARLGPKRSSISWHVTLSCSCSTCPFLALEPSIASKKHQRIAECSPRHHQPLERPAPLSHWQLSSSSNCTRAE